MSNRCTTVFGLSDARIVAPGSPHRSVVNYRLSTLLGGRMPRVGSHHIDRDGVRLIRRWIASMKPRSPDTDDVQAQLDILTHETGESSSRVVEELLSSTSGALALVGAIDENSLPLSLTEQILEQGARHPDPYIQHLFEGYLPEANRAERLGTQIDPQQILRIEGDVNRGRDLLMRSGGLACLSCHLVEGQGHAVGPDLTKPSETASTREALLDSLLRPSDKINQNYATYLIETDDGRVHTGLLVKEERDAVILLQAGGKRVRLERDDIEEMTRQPQSLMPNQLLKDLTAQQAADLLEYLVWLGGKKTED